MHVKGGQEQKEIEQNLWGFSKDGDFFAPVINKKGGYKTQIKMQIPGTPELIVLLQVNPYVHSRPFLRAELNTDKLGSDGLAYVKSQLDYLLPFGYAQLLNNGKITRADFAIDIYGVHIEEIVTKPHRLRSHRSIVGQDSVLETVYFGSPRGNQLVVYDKVKQLKSVNLEPEHEVMTRIEARRKPNLPFLSLPDMPNPFAKTEILDLSVINSLDPAYVLQLFRDSCRVRGLKAALKILPSPVRSKFLKTLNGTGYQWWNPDAIWEGWPENLDSLGLIKVPHPYPDLATMNSIISEQLPAA